MRNTVLDQLEPQGIAIGQIRSGRSMLVCPASHHGLAHSPGVMSPGKVGGDGALTEVFEILGKRPGGMRLHDGGRMTLGRHVSGS